MLREEGAECECCQEEEAGFSREGRLSCWCACLGLGSQGPWPLCVAVRADRTLNSQETPGLSCGKVLPGGLFGSKGVSQHALQCR